MKPQWAFSMKSYVFIFNVERGLSIFIRTPLNQGIIYDFGKSATFSPSTFLIENIIPHLSKYKNHSVAQTIISHPHADHIQDIACLVTPNKGDSPFYATLHTCPHDKEKSESINWDRIKNPEGTENLIKIYKEIYQDRNLPLQTIVYDSNCTIPNIEYGIYYIRPPVIEGIFEDDQKYANGISLVMFYRHGKHTLLIPGDIPPEILELILEGKNGLEKRYTIFDKNQMAEHPDWHKETSDQPTLKSLLATYGLSVLIAPHHGLESGFSKNLYDALKSGKPGVVAISEKKHLSDNDGKVAQLYQSKEGAIGQYVEIEGEREFRYSISTCNGHHILIILQGTGGCPEIYLEKDPDKLLGQLT